MLLGIVEIWRAPVIVDYEEWKSVNDRDWIISLP